MPILHHPSSILSRRQRGFTLLEVVIALAILSIGILAVARIFPGAKLVVEHAAQRTMAQTLAEKVLRYYQDHPEQLPDAYRPVIGWHTVGQLNTVCADPALKPSDSEQGYAAVCGNPPSTTTIETIDRVVGEEHVVNFGDDFPGFVMLRNAPFVPLPNVPVSPPDDQPDVKSLRAYIDVPLIGPPASVTGDLSALTPTIFPPNPAAYDMRFVPVSAGAPYGNSVGTVLIDNLEPLRATGVTSLTITANGSNPVGPFSYRVFRCSYQWRAANGIIHQVHNERHYDFASRSGGILNQRPWRFRLQIPNNGLLVTEGAPNFAGPFRGQPTSLSVVEEVDVSYRIGLNPLVPASDTSTGRVNFWAGRINAVAGDPTPYVGAPALAALPVGTRVKFDYSLAPQQNKRLRTMIEDGEVPSSSVLRLPIRPLLQPDATNTVTVRLVELGGGQFLVRDNNWNPNGGVALNAAADYGVDYEKGEITFNLNRRPAKTPIRVVYLPAEDWIVQVQRAGEVYVPSNVSIPTETGAIGGIPAVAPPPASPSMALFPAAQQMYRQYAANEGGGVPGPSLNAPPLNLIGFHRSETGKQVSVDYLDSTGATVSGELHTITLSGAPEFGANFPAQVRLSRTYSRLLRVAGVSVRVRVLWGEGNNYREVVASGTVGVEK